MKYNSWLYQDLKDNTFKQQQQKKKLLKLLQSPQDYLPDSSPPKA
jgi:hypothetical protein